MPKITEMFAFVGEETPGDEGICAFNIGNLMMPMVGADMARVDILRPMAKRIAEASGIKLRLIKFTTRTELEEIE